MSSRAETILVVVRSLGTFITAWMLIVGILVFLDRLLTGLQDPDLASIDAATLGIVIGGFVSILAALVNSLFQGEATRSASRSSAQATQAGVQAALTAPPTVQPVADMVTPPSGRPCLDCGRTAEEHMAVADHPYRPE